MKRSPLIRRKPIRRRAEGPTAAREPKPWAEPTVQPIARGSYAGGTTGPAPKGEKARPGKRTPTKAEARWMAQIVAYGCIACRLDGYGYVPAEVHHILRGGVRMGHMHTISLCSGHHRRGAGRPGLIARHPDKTWFELRYGPEAELLSRLRTEVSQ